MGQKSSSPDSRQPESGKAAGSQTLQRGLDLMCLVADGPVSLQGLADRVGLSRSTTHRLAAALVERGFLTLLPREGYKLGPMLMQLGFVAQSQTDLIQAARPHLEELAATSEDTVHLGRLEEDLALYLDKIPGRRRINISSRVGEQQPLTCTGLGKALLLDSSEAEWLRLFDHDTAAGLNTQEREVWLQRMRNYARRQCAYDLEENEDRLRCVAAPVRDASGKIVAAISLSCAAQYMSDERMDALSDLVSATAEQIGHDLGWSGERPTRASR